jgi:hypothetical protein
MLPQAEQAASEAEQTTDLPREETNRPPNNPPALVDVARQPDPNKGNLRRRRERKARQATAPPTGILLSTRKMADKFSVCMRTIDRWVEAEILPPPKRVRGRRFWPSDTEPRLDPPDMPSPAQHFRKTEVSA